MLENTENKPFARTTILRSLITPAAIGVLLSLTEEEIAATFATVSEECGVKASYTRASWRQLARHISAAIAPKR